MNKHAFSMRSTQANELPQSQTDRLRPTHRPYQTNTSNYDQMQMDIENSSIDLSSIKNPFQAAFEFQQLESSFRQWRQRLAPNPDQILSVNYGVDQPEIDELGPQIQRSKTVKQLKLEQKENLSDNLYKKSQTDDPLYKNQEDAKLIEQPRHRQKGIIKRQEKRGQNKFRLSSNSHRIRQKRFRQMLWNIMVEQRFFFDNAKYRYQSQKTINNVLALSAICTQKQDYADQAAIVNDHITYHREINVNQYQKAVAEKIKNLFRRTSNLATTFF